MLWLAIPSLLLGCDGNSDEADGPTDDTGPLTQSGDTGAYPWPVWLYIASLDPRTSTFAAVDGAPALQLDGYTWGLMFGGPTLVAELDHEIRFDITNRTAGDLSFQWAGVEVVEEPSIAAGTNAANIFRTTLGSGVFVGGVPGGADRLGAFSLVTVRDPAVFPVEALDFQLNLVMIDLPAEHSRVDACRFDAATAGKCPAWRPAVSGETTTLVTQRVFANPNPLRHGSGPNEFLTVAVETFDVTAGSNVRLNLASMADGAHTIDLGGLSAIDPSGAAVTQVSLEPGATSWLLLEAIGPAGVYELGCVEHDHRGLGTIALTVSE